jgi:hypothetical protein
MLHRATSFLQRIQEANSVLSTEFTELVKELPAPSAPDWEDRVSKINELFKMTGELAGEVQDEIFRKSSEVVHKKPADSPTKPNIAKSADPAPVAQENVQHDNPVEPELIAEPIVEPEPQPEMASDEQVSESEIVMEAEPVDESITEPIDMELKDRLDRLFGQIQTDEDQQNTKAADSSKKPGVLSRIFGRQSKKIDKHQADNLPVADQENEAKVEYSVVEPNSPKLPDLLGDTAREVGDIFLEDTTPQQVHPYNESIEQPELRLSWWFRLKKRIDDERYRRVMLALERHEMRKAQRRNRRIKPQKPGGEAPAAG